MKKIICIYLLIAFSLTVKAQDNIYFVSAIKGTVTNAAGKKIVIGEKLHLSDKLLFTSEKAVLVLANQTFGRVVVTPGNSNKNIIPKNNIFTVLLKDILPSNQVAVKMAENSIPPKPKRQVNKNGDTILLPASKLPAGY